VIIAMMARVMIVIVVIVMMMVIEHARTLYRAMRAISRRW
jgi:hypothetical protein